MSKPVGPTTSAILGTNGDSTRQFTLLYERLAPAVSAWARLHLVGPISGRMMVEDFVQELWCRAISRFASFEPLKGSFRAWLFGIAQHLLLESLRSLARQSRGQVIAKSAMDVPDSVTTISRRLTKDEGLTAFAEHVAHLPKDEKELLQWRGLEGLDHAEIAIRMKLSRDVVMKRWQRLRERLIPVIKLEGLIED